jgi:(5-formylfuran-3-yl)methyl phosphate synthase
MLTYQVLSILQGSIEMRLLVSVRSEDEVAAALDGGADIIDAKEPSHGSIGAVSPGVLGRIIERVPAECPLSIALGDIANPRQLQLTISTLDLPPRIGPVYLKVGFAGVASPGAIAKLLGTAVQAAARRPASPHIIGVAYADYSVAQTATAERIRAAALDAGCSGILLDTFGKIGGNLLTWYSAAALARWISEGRENGLLMAIAGGLGTKEAACVSALRPDVLGVRGAACDGGRTGAVNSTRVAQLRALLRCDSGFLQAAALASQNNGSRKA